MNKGFCEKRDSEGINAEIVLKPLRTFRKQKFILIFTHPCFSLSLSLSLATTLEN